MSVSRGTSMAIAHVCQVCGTDLARCRPATDPRYGLPLVTCPGCGTACVRRRHPLQIAGRSGRRTAGAIGAMAVQLAAALFFGLVTVVGALHLSRLVTVGSDAPQLREIRYVMFAMLGVVGPALTGAWLTAGLHHWRRPVAWLAWTLLSAVAITLVYVAGAIEDFGPELRVDLAGVLESAAFRRDIAQPWSRTMLTLLVLVAVGVLGVPLGAWLLRASEVRRRLVWRRRRRQLRRIRGSATGMQGW